MYRSYSIANRVLPFVTKALTASFGKVQIWGIILQPQPPHTRQKKMNKNMATNCRVCLVLKQFGPYFVQISVHSFALYVGGGGHSRVSENQVAVIEKEFDKERDPRQVMSRSSNEANKAFVALLLSAFQASTVAVRLSVSFCPSPSMAMGEIIVMGQPRRKQKQIMAL